MKSKKEVSDKVVFILLVVAIIISVLAVYMIFDYTSNDKFVSGETTANVRTEYVTTGQIVLNVVESETNAEGGEV